ncbi:hypothetical protein KY084_10710 [Stakelama sp. CBK3Z-3]|uniref:Uncharacterized protein n=1 Tax=Stakelama flava TaxID=2860338 RepID=A0ABS6XM99_9SPHN|nr:hypothetical protein [Stakelama flava]MBW4331343.1 hypothetical protein [Stakelama flava]
MRTTLVLAGLTLLAACNSGGRDADEAPDNGSVAIDIPTRETPAPSPSPSPSATPTSIADSGEGASDSSGARPLLPTGWGPLRIGMTKAAVSAALGPDSNPDDVNGPDPASCEIYRPADAPQGMTVMLVDGRLARITLARGSDVKTSTGIGIGSPVSAIGRAYGARAKSSPHQYADAPAEYRTVWSTGGGGGQAYVQDPSARGIRFEVNEEGRVQFIHAGGPAIQYVEGCA